MYSWILAGIGSFLIPTSRAPEIVRPGIPQLASHPIKISKPGSYDYTGKVYVMGKIPSVVVEYGTPALHAMATAVNVSNFAWRGSMESLHVGSQPFISTGMRQKHTALEVTLDHLFCDDVGEDCVSIQPRAKVTITASQFQGQRGRTVGDSHAPGHDKLVQIDGASVVLDHCDFFDGVRAVRGKANSTITLRFCRFIRCETCVAGDGEANPRPETPYDNGKPGPCKILLEDCECWDCEEVARAHPACTIELVRFNARRTLRWDGNGGGVVIRH